MKRRLLLGIIVLVVVSAGIVFAGGRREAAPVDDTLVFGNITFARTDVWNNYSVEAFNYAARKMGVETVVLDSEAEASRAISNMEDLVSRGVDAVSVFVMTPELAVRMGQMANEADIPITYENSMPGDGNYDYLGVVAAQYDDIGYAAGEYISQTWPGAKLFYVMGQPGMNIVEPYMDGLERALAEYGTVELVGSQPTDWGAEQAMNVTQNFIQSGQEFDVIFANNEQMAQGVMNALKDAGLFGQIPIVATGGGPAGLDMIRAGEIQATMSAPVSIQGMITFLNLYNYVVEGRRPPEKFVPLPIIPVTEANVADAISWEPGDEAFEYARQYLENLR